MKPNLSWQSKRVLLQSRKKQDVLYIHKIEPYVKRFLIEQHSKTKLK